MSKKVSVKTIVQDTLQQLEEDEIRFDRPGHKPLYKLVPEVDITENKVVKFDIVNVLKSCGIDPTLYIITDVNAEVDITGRDNEWIITVKMYKKVKESRI